MKSTLVTISTLFVATALALPAPAPQGGATAAPTATISFSNDQTGAHAPVVAPIDGTVINLYDVLTGTPIGVPVQVLASSAQLVAFPQNVDCTITDINGNVIGTLTAQHTYVDLDGTNTAVPINLAGATLECTPLLLSS